MVKQTLYLVFSSIHILSVIPTFYSATVRYGLGLYFHKLAAARISGALLPDHFDELLAILGDCGKRVIGWMILSNRVVTLTWILLCFCHAKYCT